MTSVLAVDVGGSHVKALVEGESEPRRADSGPRMTAEQMVAALLRLTEGWSWDRASIGIPSPVHGGRVVSEPINLGKGWVGFDYGGALGVPARGNSLSGFGFALFARAGVEVCSP